MEKFFTFGLEDELVFLPKFSAGWNALKIPKQYKNQANYEMYCYLRYCGIDAEAMFLEKIKK